MHGIFIGLNNPNPFFYLTNRVKNMRILKLPLLNVIGYLFFSEFPLIILFTLYIHVSRKKNQPKVSSGFGKN